MSEEQIINAIANACGDDTLYFQVIVDDSTLHIYVNRQDLAELDYPQLKQKIYTATLDLFPLEFQRIWLYSRVLGEVEPDWQSVLEVDAISLTSDRIAPAIESIATAVETTNSIVEKIEKELKTTESFAEDSYWEIDDLPTTADDNSEESQTESELVDPSLNLSQYCFIRNQRLLYTVLDAPDRNIARAIDTFDWFDSSIQRSLLPILEVYFEKSIVPAVDSFPLEVQTWWTKIEQLDSESKRMLAIWLSRYCLNPEQTITTIKEVLTNSDDPIEDESHLPKISFEINSNALSNSSTTPSPSDLKSQSDKQANSGLMTNIITLLNKLFKGDRPR